MAHEGRLFFAIHHVHKPWSWTWVSALAMGGPVLMGAWGHQLSAGLTASLGALVFLYLPDTSLSVRLRSLMMSSVVMLVAYGMGVLISTEVLLQAPILMLLTALTTVYCRLFALGGPPGSLFFVIAAAIAASVATPPEACLTKLLEVAAGCLWAVMVAGLYELLVSAKHPHITAAPKKEPLSTLCPEATAIGCVVGTSFLLAQAFGLDKPYWVATSCLAVIQGGSLREIWNKQLHRMVGTSLGLVFVAVVFSAPPDSDWQIAAWIVFFTFAIDLTVARHYATAVMFITPMTLLLADAGHTNPASWRSLAQLRLLDTVLGCALGLLGGLLLHRMKQVDRRF